MRKIQFTKSFTISLKGFATKSSNLITLRHWNELKLTKNFFFLSLDGIFVRFKLLQLDCGWLLKILGVRQQQICLSFFQRNTRDLVAFFLPTLSSLSFKLKTKFSSFHSNIFFLQLTARNFRCEIITFHLSFHSFIHPTNIVVVSSSSLSASSVTEQSGHCFSFAKTEDDLNPIVSNYTSALVKIVAVSSSRKKKNFVRITLWLRDEMEPSEVELLSPLPLYSQTEDCLYIRRRRILA